MERVYPYALLEYFREWLRVEYAQYYTDTDTDTYLPSRLKDAKDAEQVEKPKKRGWLK